MSSHNKKTNTMYFSSIFTSTVAAILLLASFGLSQPICPLCPNGSSDYLQDKIVPGFWNNSGATCRELELHGINDEYELCDFSRLHASWCGCPGVAVSACILCPAATEPVLANLQLSFRDTNLTCGEMNYLSHTINPNDPACGFYAEFFFDTCGGCIETVAPTTIPTISSSPPAMPSVQQEPICPLCPNGSLAYNHFKIVPGFWNNSGVTCRELELFAINDEYELCDFSRSMAEWCECPPTPSSLDEDDDEPICSICPNGSTDYIQDKTVPGSWEHSGLTCRELELLANTVDYECSFARLHASWCGCPGSESECDDLCPAATEPVLNDVQMPATDSTCGEINYHTHTDSAYCGSYPEFLVVCGGCTALPLFIPPEDKPEDNSTGCGLCPDGESSPVPNKAVFDEATSCGELEYYLGFSDTNPFESCEFAHYIGISECGCNDTLPQVPGNASCYVCEDASVPAELDFEIFANLTCRELGYFIATENNETCAAIQATAGAYCGCNNTGANETACRICGGDSLLPDPARLTVDGSGNGASCLDIEFLANSGNFTCNEAQNTWASFCCTTDAPTDSPAPSAAPSVKPSTAPSPSPTTSFRPTDSQAPSTAPTSEDDSVGNVLSVGIYSVTLGFLGTSLLLVQ